MDYRLNIVDLKSPEDIQRLKTAISEAFDQLDTLVTTTTAPNGNISGREGQVCLYKNGSTWEVWFCLGLTVWQQIDASISIPLTYLDTDIALAANSDVKVASQKATKAYVDTKVPVPLTTVLGGTGATAAANAASGVVVLNASSQLPAVSGALLTNLPVSDTNTSNVIFSWNGCEYYDATATISGFVTSTSLTDITTAGAYSYIRIKNSTYRTILSGKFVKIAGISTITINAKIWAGDTNAGREAILNVDIGGQSNTVKSVTSTTPTWITASTIDVSGLTNGTTYDITIQLKNETNEYYAFCSAVVLIAS